MSLIRTIGHRVRRWARRRRRRDPAPTVWYHEEYRIPIEGLGLETRRPDLVAWALLDFGVVDTGAFARPHRVPYSALAAVHAPNVLEALSSAQAMAPIFGAHPSELPMDRIATTIRLACGATLAAARRAVAGAGPQVNLLGGFHHASPARAGGFSVVNDIAVAIRALRDDGFEGRIAVLDLDAHPPDGTADCVAADPMRMGEVWIGSISGSDWGDVGEVDETFAPGVGDDEYLALLDRLLARMPRAKLAFVVCGGDVLDQDRFGGLALSVEGARRRDERVRHKLGKTPSVWLAAGGYSEDAWRVLFNTVVALALDTPIALPDDYDPVRMKFSRVARSLTPPRADEDFLSELDIAEALGLRPAGGIRLMSTYTAEWIERALYEYGILTHIERLGYSRFHVDLARMPDGDRARLYGHAEGEEHLLFEMVVDRVHDAGEEYLFVNWLTLRHPLAQFTPARPRLPNQEVPGLGLAKETGELLALMAQRLGLKGVAIRPAAYHVAYTARRDFSFVDPARQARFEALVRDLRDVPLAEATVAIDQGRVTRDGEVYRWEPDLMVVRLDGRRTRPEGDGGRFALA